MAGLISKEKSKEYKWTIPILRQKCDWVGWVGKKQGLPVFSTGKKV